MTAANNMANSYLLAGVTAGVRVRIAGPEATCRPRRSSRRPKTARRRPAARCSSRWTPPRRCCGADVVATDTWVYIGQEDEKEARLQLFRGYAVDEAA